MERKERIENNILICKFMNYTIEGNDFIFPKEMYDLYIPSNIYEFETGNYNFSCDIIDMKFHNSFDWLMPVVEKINSIDWVTIYSDECKIHA